MFYFLIKLRYNVEYLRFIRFYVRSVVQYILTVDIIMICFSIIYEFAKLKEDNLRSAQEA